jgi:hypothetical protein
MPQNKVQWLNEKDVLDYDEIIRLVSILADLGIKRSCYSLREQRGKRLRDIFTLMNY